MVVAAVAGPVAAAAWAANVARKAAAVASRVGEAEMGKGVAMVGMAVEEEEEEEAWGICDHFFSRPDHPHSQGAAFIATACCCCWCAVRELPPTPPPRLLLLLAATPLWAMTAGSLSTR